MGDGLRRPAGFSSAGGSKRWAVCVALLFAAVPSACSSKNGESSEARAPSGHDDEQSLLPVACGKDQVREFRCDALLPLSSSLPAPEPYAACPGVIDVVNPTYVPLAKTAAFDAVHTEFMRRRAPPGHQCCYSWCSRLEVASVSEVPPDGRCNEPLAFPEQYCIPEPEGRISTELAQAPFDRCPAAVRPPEAAVFSVPVAAALHPGLTSERRLAGERTGQAFGECCYAWCSIAPPGTGLERRR
jgi:hypothetical protein